MKEGKLIKRGIIGVGILLILGIVGVYISEVRYRQSIDEQLRQLFTPIIEESVIAINGENYVCEYVEGRLDNHKAFPFKDHKARATIEVALYKDGVETRHAMGTHDYDVNIKRKHLKAPLEIDNIEGRDYVTSFMGRVLMAWYHQWMSQYGQLNGVGLSSEYDKSSIEYDQDGKVIATGQVIGKGTLDVRMKIDNQEKRYSNNWRAEFVMPFETEGTHIKIAVDVDESYNK